jgi:hypothetical protein
MIRGLWWGDLEGALSSRRGMISLTFVGIFFALALSLK